MALNVCNSCTTKFAVGLPRCPHCASTDFREDGQMAKITAHGGPSDKTLTADTPEPDALLAPAEDDALAAEPEPVAEGGEEPSPGTSSSASTETPQSNSELSEPSSPKRARKTASRSSKAQTESSSADSTDGAKTDELSAADHAEA